MKILHINSDFKENLTELDIPETLVNGILETLSKEYRTVGPFATADENGVLIGALVKRCAGEPIKPKYRITIEKVIE